jgi:hypothetical protein
MPNSIKKKRNGIMKGGMQQGTGGGGTVPAAPAGPAVGPLMTPAAVSLAEAESQRLYDVLVQAIRTNRQVNRSDLVNYLLYTYNTQRIGMAPVVLPGLANFLDTFTPDALNVAKTTDFCKNLFGFMTPEFRELLTRGASNVSQCKKAGYPRSELPLVCIWCGEPIYDMAECEHSLPITACAGLLGFSSNPDRSRLEHILEYGYAHRLCNQVKLDVPFLTWNDTTDNWAINWPNMSRVYNDIATKGTLSGYKNASSLAYTYNDGQGNFNYSPLGGPIPMTGPEGPNSIVAPHNSPYRGNYNMPGTAPTNQKNKLTENGEHRNKREILEACGELEGLTNNPTATAILAGGAKSKKSKKKQRGGALTFKLPKLVESRMIDNQTELEQYLGQDLGLPGYGKKWLQSDNGKLYGPHRMRLIEEYCKR